jgi:hypothetical protein
MYGLFKAGESTHNETEKVRLQDSEKKYTNITLTNYKQNFT